MKGFATAIGRKCAPAPIRHADKDCGRRSASDEPGVTIRTAALKEAPNQKAARPVRTERLWSRYQSLPVLTQLPTALISSSGRA